MNKLKFLIPLAALFGASLSTAAVAVGDAAPDFTLPDAHGAEVTLSEHRGSFVVLEWVNPGCPFVVKFYDVGEMQRLQKEVVGKGAKWIAINSSNPNHRDYMTPEQTRAYMEEKNVHVPWLMDEDGAVGRAFGAVRTPEMFVINPEGVIVYHGAIDSIPSANSDDIERADNFVVAALTAAMAGEEIERAQTRPYGCTIKY